MVGILLYFRADKALHILKGEAILHLPFLDLLNKQSCTFPAQLKEAGKTNLTLEPSLFVNEVAQICCVPANELLFFAMIVQGSRKFSPHF